MSSPLSRQSQKTSPRRSRRTASGNAIRDYQENAAAAPSRPPRNYALSVDTGTARRYNNASPYQADSDSDEDRTRRRHNKRSILKSGRDFLGRFGGSRDFDEDEGYDSTEEFPLPANAIARDDDSEASDECMILTDDEDDASETEEEPVKKTGNDFTDIYGVASPRSSQAQSNLAAIQSMFADKHPWRRQSRRDSTKPYSGPRVPSISSMDDDMGEPSSVRSTLRERISVLGILQSRSEEEEEMDESSSSSEDEASSTQSSASILSDPEEELDFASLERIPNYFTSHPQVMLTYLDPSSQNMSNHDANLFAYEHSLLLRASLQLLAERDYIGVEADLDDPTCIVKKGPLKKAAHSVGRTTWRVKYVEIRPGSFSYFEDSAKRENFGRKSISLRSNRCTCEIVGTGQNLFALEVEGGPRRLWMTNSDEECRAWVRAIKESMIGVGAGDCNHSFDVSQYQAALDQFQQTQLNLYQAANKDDYMSSIEELLQTSLRVPTQWISSRANVGDGTQSEKVSSASAQTRSSVTGFWKSMKQEDSISINGSVVSGSSPHATERVIGALSRCILELDKSSPVEGHVEMSELQALSFARDVMMILLRSRCNDKSRMALEYLCQNPNLISIEQLETKGTSEPLKIQLSYAVSEASQNTERDISGWIGSRTRFKGLWRNRFLIISDGILNVFEHSSPRPHGLRGQLLLSGADVSIVQDKPKNEAHLHILRIVSKNKESERQLAFPDETMLNEWKAAVERAMDSSSSPEHEDDPSTLVTPRASMLPAAGGRIIQGASESGVKIIKGATGQIVKATDIIRASMRSSSKGTHSRTSSIDVRGSRHSDRAETNDSFGLTSSFESEVLSKLEPTVQIAAESTTMYNIVGTSSDSPVSDATDIWMTARVKTLHTFLLSGGSHCRLNKGDELVEMEFRHGAVSAEVFLPSEALSP